MKADHLHRVHLGHDATGKGWRVDIKGGSWRYEGDASGEVKKAMALRIATTWNVCEGIPTADLLKGVARLRAADAALKVTGVDCECCSESPKGAEPTP